MMILHLLSIFPVFQTGFLMKIFKIFRSLALLARASKIKVLFYQFFMFFNLLKSKNAKKFPLARGWLICLFLIQFSCFKNNFLKINLKIFRSLAD